MSEEKFTKGPWMKSGVRSTSPTYKGHGVGPDSDWVVIVPYNDKDHSECLANAHLIAAAPELYDELLDRYTQTKCGCAHPACRRCADDNDTEHVLAKARGEI